MRKRGVQAAPRPPSTSFTPQFGSAPLVLCDMENVLFGCGLGSAKKTKGFLGHCPRKVGRPLKHSIYRMKDLMHMGAPESCAFLQTRNPTAHPTTPQDSTASTTSC